MITNTSKPTPSSITNSTKIGVFTADATLVAGTKTVTNANVLAIDNITLRLKTAGGTPGTLSIGTITPGVSFIINSTSNLDTSVVTWQFIQ
jgi:hypothetical protein